MGAASPAASCLRAHAGAVRHAAVPPPGPRQVLRPEPTSRRTAARATSAWTRSRACRSRRSIAQKILSCVARLAAALRGRTRDRRAARRRFGERDSIRGTINSAPTGCCARCRRRRSPISSTNWSIRIFCERTAGDRPVLRLTGESLEVLRGEREVRLIEPKSGPVRKTRTAVESWEGVDRDLFEHLRSLRQEIARDRAVPAYVVFSDRTLRDMARVKPTDELTLRSVHGVGEKKLADFGARFLEAIGDFCRGQLALHRSTRQRSPPRAGCGLSSGGSRESRSRHPDDAQADPAGGRTGLRIRARHGYAPSFAPPPLVPR